MLKDMFSGTMVDMLKAELDTELGYRKTTKITNTFPEAIVCRCMVHLVRNSTKYIPTKYRKEFCTDLKAIYGAVSEGEAENALSVLNEKWEKQYSSAVKVWDENFCYVQRLFDYPAEIRKIFIPPIRSRALLRHCVKLRTAKPPSQTKCQF